MLSWKTLGSVSNVSLRRAKDSDAFRWWSRLHNGIDAWWQQCGTGVMIITRRWFLRIADICLGSGSNENGCSLFLLPPLVDVQVSDLCITAYNTAFLSDTPLKVPYQYCHLLKPPKTTGECSVAKTTASLIMFYVAPSYFKITRITPL